MKLAQPLHGALSNRAPYAMRKRIEKVLGSPPKPKPRTQIGTVGTSTGTVVGPVPAGMGRIKKAQTVNPVTTQKNLLGGGKSTVGPHMKITVKPTTPMTIKAAFPTEEDCFDAMSEPDIEAALLTKEGSYGRAVHTLETLSRLESTGDLNVKLACIVELAGMHKEASLSAALREGIARRR